MAPLVVRYLCVAAGARIWTRTLIDFGVSVAAVGSQPDVPHAERTPSSHEGDVLTETRGRGKKKKKKEKKETEKKIHAKIVSMAILYIHLAA